MSLKYCIFLTGEGLECLVWEKNHLTTSKQMTSDGHSIRQSSQVQTETPHKMTHLTV